MFNFTLLSTYLAVVVKVLSLVKLWESLLAYIIVMVNIAHVAKFTMVDQYAINESMLSTLFLYSK